MDLGQVSCWPHRTAGQELDAAESGAIGKAGDALRRLDAASPKGRVTEVIRGVGPSTQGQQPWVASPPTGLNLADPTQHLSKVHNSL